MRMKAAFFTLVLSIATGAAPASADPLDIKPIKGGIPQGYEYETAYIRGRYSTEKAAQQARDYVVGKINTPVRQLAEFQWPGIYIESEFSGTEALIEFANDTDAFKVSVDGGETATVVRPGELIYRIANLKAGWHRLRIEKINESQDTVGRFGGVWLPTAERSRWFRPRPRQIEFIGASSSIGYGNTSPKRQCTKDEVWATTDSSQAYPILTAKHYNADYQLNAFSGRGMVRNYDGIAPTDPLPALYPYRLFDKKTEYESPAWQPQIIVIGLGGNDFSTPLHAGEKWANEAALKADFEASYVAFVKNLRVKHPKAFFILTSNDSATVDAEVSKVVAKLKADGETQLDYLAMTDFGRTGCDWHFDLNDHKKIFGIFTSYIDTHPELWQGK